MEYKIDETLEYRPLILKGLQVYNKQFTGDKETDIQSFYILQDNRLVGACITEMGWDWVYLTKIFYHNSDVLSKLMNKIKEYYFGRVEGILYESFDTVRVEQFVNNGFEDRSILENMPKGLNNHFLVLTDMSHSIVDQATHSKDGDLELNKIIDLEVNTYNLEQNITDEKIEVEYVALDGKTFAGGVYCHIKYD